MELKATNGAERIISQTLASDATEFNIENVTYGEEWNVTLTAVNAEGRSLPVSTGLKIGKTAIGFLSVYPTPDELISKGDDDEACACLWFHGEPDVVNNATPYVRQWYADGGALLLWSHATVYVGTLGRLDMSMLRDNDHTIGTGAGG